jgi:hypothetical protein
MQYLIRKGLIILNEFGRSIMSGNCNKDRLHSAFPKVFDWIKAAKIIDESNIQNASVALDMSLENTYPILKNGKPLKSEGNVFEYQVDNPMLIDDDTGQIINCFFHIDRESRHKTSFMSTSNEDRTPLRWPEKAIDILTNSFYYKDIF